MVVTVGNLERPVLFVAVRRRLYQRDVPFATAQVQAPSGVGPARRAAALGALAFGPGDPACQEFSAEREAAVVAVAVDVLTDQDHTAVLVRELTVVVQFLHLEAFLR